MISVVGVTHASDGQSTDTANNSKFSKVGVTKGPYPVPLVLPHDVKGDLSPPPPPLTTAPPH